MINFNPSTQTFTITDLGRIAAKYYISHLSIKTFNEDFRSVMTEADVLGMLSKSTEVCMCAPSEELKLILVSNSLVRYKCENRNSGN